MTTKINTEWPWPRREKLAREIDEKLNPYCPERKEKKHRNFSDEAKAKLPALHKEIDAYNRAVSKENNDAHKARSDKRSEYRRIARFGDESEVARIAAEILK